LVKVSYFRRFRAVASFFNAEGLARPRPAWAGCIRYSPEAAGPISEAGPTPAIVAQLPALLAR